jgi:hypothetical protein
MILFGVVAVSVLGQKNDVQLEDAKRFADWKADRVAACRERVALFGEYLSERRREEADRAERDRLRGEVEANLLTRSIYLNLRTLANTKESDKSKLDALRTLRRRLGETDYEKGKVPPPVPQKDEKDFRAWLTKRGKVDPMPPPKPQKQ